MAATTDHDASAREVAQMAVWSVPEQPLLRLHGPFDAATFAMDRETITAAGNHVGSCQTWKGLVEEVSRKTYTYNVTRDGRFWLIHVPELDRFTQARNLRELEGMVVDLISIVTNQPATSFDHQLGSFELPDSVAGHLETARKLREQAARAQHDAAEEARKAARELSDDGIPLRDIGRLMGVSYQRAHQLVTNS